MTIPTIPGFDQDIGPALSSLTDTIGSLVNPNAKFNQALKGLFLEKPELMQKFVDIEKANPGTLKAFGFNDKSTNLLQGMQESIPAIRERLLAPEVQKQLETQGAVRGTAATRVATGGMTPGEVVGDKLQAYLNSGGIELIKKDPQAFVRGVRKTLGIGSEFEQVTEQSALTAYKKGDALKDLSPNQIVDKIKAGTISLGDLSGGALNPETRAGTQFALKMYQDDREAALRRELVRSGHELNDWEARAKLSAAIDQYQASGGVGTLAAHYKSIWGDSYSGQEPSDEDMNAVHHFMQDTQADKRGQQLNRLFKTISPMIGAINNAKKPVPDEVADRYASQINDALKASGDSTWTAFTDRKGLFSFLGFGPKKILFKTREGLVTDDPSAITSAIPPSSAVRTNPTAGLSGPEQQTAAWLKSLPDSAREGEIKKMFDADSASGGDGSRVNKILDAAGIE